MFFWVVFCLLHQEITATEVVSTLKEDDTWHLLYTPNDAHDDDFVHVGLLVLLVATIRRTEQ